MNKLVIASVVATTALTGCASSTKLDPNYQAYVVANQSTLNSYKSEIQLFKLKAKPGEQITLGGVEEFTVSMPAPKAPEVQQRVEQPNEWAGVVSRGLGVVGTVLGIKFAGQAAADLAGAVGNVARVPQANVTTTTTNTSTVTDTYTNSNVGTSAGNNRDLSSVDSHNLGTATTSPYSITESGLLP